MAKKKSTKALVESVDKKSLSNIERNIEKWAKVVSYLRFYPDIFYDLITPETGAKIKLRLDQRVELRCLSRFKSSYCVKPRGSGKCVTKDSLLLTTNGVKEIGSLFDYQNDGNETLKDLDIEIVNRYGNVEKSLKGIYSGKKPTIKITTNEGFSIEGTYNHPLLVMNTNGSLEFKKLKEICNGDYVCLRRGDNVWGSALGIDVTKQMVDWLNSRTPIQNAPLNKRELPNTLTEDFAYFIGLLFGDGSIVSESAISFSNIDTDVIDRFFSIAKDTFKIKYIRQCNKNDYQIYDKYLRKYLEFVGVEYLNSRTKQFPKFIMDAPKNIVRAFIQGLFDTDGCGEKTCISYSSVSFQLIRQLQILLLNFGVVSSLKHKVDRLGNNSYNLYIYGENIEIFNQEIGFLCAKKKNRALVSGKKKHNTNRDIIPYQFKYCKEVYPFTHEGNHNFLYHCGKYGDCDMTYYRLHQLVYGNFGDYPNKEHFEELSKVNYFYSQVTTIEYGENDVYDIQTDNTHSFVANGFVNHNTMIAIMAAFHTCIFYPTVMVALTAQTKENSAKLIKDKLDEMLLAFPLLAEEIVSKSISKDLVEITFANGSKLVNLANNQSVKGSHVQRGYMDEDNLTDEETFHDALEPVFTTVKRRTVGKFCIEDPYEMNGQINFLTSAGYKNSPAYFRCLSHFENMVNLKGEMCLGASWRLPNFFGMGTSKAEALKKKQETSIATFDMNYEATWTGATDKALVSITKLMECRTLQKPEFISNPMYEYVLGVDVARSDNADNNETSVAILKVVRRANGKIKEVQLVNLINISGTLNFEAQTIEIKRIRKKYEACCIVVDDNGLGKAISDLLVKEHIDPLTGESLGCFATINSDREPEIAGSPQMVFCYVAQKYDSRSIPMFIDAVTTGKLRLLEKHIMNEQDLMDESYAEKSLPFVNTDLFMDEVSNLQLITLNNGSLSIGRVEKKLNKDRFSAVQYGLWYILTYMEQSTISTKSDEDFVNELNFGW